MKVISEIVYTIELDTETNESRVIKQRFLTKGDVKVDDSSETPSIVRDKTKLTFNQAALDLLRVTEGDFISVMYRTEGTKAFPVIGKSSVFNTENGNKITKKGTISFRGDMNKTLEEFGSNFTLVESKDPDVYFLKGDLERAEIPDEVVDINKELDFSALDEQEDLTVDDTDLSFDFSL